MANKIENNVVVAKFGGSMTATAETLRRTAELIMEDPLRNIIVVSAPGKTSEHQDKITDVLLAPFKDGVAERDRPQALRKSFAIFRRRIEKIDSDLGTHSTGERMDKLQDEVDHGKEFSEAEFAREGEYEVRDLLAPLVGGRPINSEDLVRLRKNGTLERFEFDFNKKLLITSRKNIIPGYSYGDHNGKSILFPRNGSDIMGAIVAHEMDATRYDNIKDTGVRAANPGYFRTTGIVPKIVKRMSQEELNEAMISGDPVLHQLAVALLGIKGTPIHIFNGLGRNRRQADVRGTWITPERNTKEGEGLIGIFGKDGYMAHRIHCPGLEGIEGAGTKIFGVLRKHGVPYVRSSDQSDSITIVIDGDYELKMQKVLAEISRGFINTDFHSEKVGIVSCIGEGLRKDDGELYERSLRALRRAGIKRVMSTNSVGRTSFMIGVPDGETASAIENLYRALIK